MEVGTGLIFVGLAIALVLLGLVIYCIQARRHINAQFSRKIIVDELIKDRLRQTLGDTTPLKSEIPVSDVLFQLAKADTNFLYSLDYWDERFALASTVSELVVYVQEKYEVARQEQLARTKASQKRTAKLKHATIVDRLSNQLANLDNKAVPIGPELEVTPNLMRNGIEQVVMGGVKKGLGIADALPLVTLGLSIARNANAVQKGDKKVGSAIQHTVYDTAAAGVGAWAGKEAGLIAGLWLATFTGGVSAIVIPVASSIAGTLLGLFAGRGASFWAKSKSLKAQVKELKKATGLLRMKFLVSYESFLERGQSYYLSRLMITCEIQKRKRAFLEIIRPTYKQTFTAVTSRRLKKEYKDFRSYFQTLAKRVERKGDLKGGLYLHAQGKAVIAGSQELVALYDEVTLAMEKVEKERRAIV